MPTKHDYTRAKRSKPNWYQLRCSRCEHRRRSTVHPDYSRRRTRCACGSLAWRVDWYRTTKIERRRYRCNCSGYHFPHRIRSKWCTENPDAPWLAETASAA